MNLARLLLVIAPILALCVGGGLARRGHGRVGVLIGTVGVVGALALAVSGTWRPLLGLIAISGFLFGIEADRPGNPGRRALGILGIAVGLFALLAATFYA
jgi:hypothetical protein